MHTPQQLGTFDLANPGMTIEQAIDIERKNVAWLEQKLQEVK